jgi:hypothetical protein
LGKQQVRYDEEGHERVECEVIGESDKVTEWKKDAWTEERGYAGNIIEYIECAKIMNMEDDDAL